MAWEARLGLKHDAPALLEVDELGLNGLGSPSGIETQNSNLGILVGDLAKWPGKPVWD